jgi:hypothetical protein
MLDCSHALEQNNRTFLPGCLDANAMDSPTVTIADIVGKAGASWITCAAFYWSFTPALFSLPTAVVGVAAVIDLMVANAENPEYQWWCCDALTGLCAGSGLLRAGQRGPKLCRTGSPLATF